MDQRKCILCGEWFNPTNHKQRKCNKEHYHPCPNCGKLVLTNTLQDVNKCCSRKCGQAIGNESRKRSNLEKYGVDNVGKLNHTFVKTCKYCGQKFQTTSPRQIYCGNDYYNCPVCGKSIKIKDMHQVGSACSLKCRQVLIESTNLKRYGNEVSVNSAQARSKAKTTCLEKYGVDHYSKTTEFKSKYKKTCIERYGTEAPLQNDEIKAKLIKTNNEKYGGNSPTCSIPVKEKVKQTVDERYGGYTWQSKSLSKKAKQTTLERYGVENAMQNEEIKAKVVSTNLEKYGAPSFMQSLQGYQISITDSSKAPEYAKFVENPEKYIKENYASTPTIDVLSKDLGVTDTPIYINLIKHNCRDIIPFKTSTMEYEVLEFIKSLIPDANIIRNDRSIINPLEIDIYLPDYKFGIECNPTITHNSSVLDPWGYDPKPPVYHKNKSEKCIAAGIQLFHIFGYEWTTKQDILKSMISNCLGYTKTRIYGRNTSVIELTYRDAKEFLDANHRQGSISAKVFIGLIDRTSNELVSVMTFNHMRNSLGLITISSDIWELSRFCNKLNTTVVGGASKLLKYFIENCSPKTIVSFSDIAHTKGILYKNLGFKQVSISDPGYVWVNLKDDSYYTRVSCQKRNLRKLFDDESIDIENKTEREIMIEHGYVQVFDSGVIRWEWNQSKRN